MRNLWTAALALAGLFALAPLRGFAAPAVAPASWQAPAGASLRHADWDEYCGPRCQYWRHRHWEQERAERWRDWHREHGHWGYTPYRQWNGYGGGGD